MAPPPLNSSFVSVKSLISAGASVIPYPASVVGVPVNSSHVLAPPSVIPYPASVVGVPVNSSHVLAPPSVMPYPANVVGVPVNSSHVLAPEIPDKSTELPPDICKLEPTSVKL